jgi:hypothetical protein
MSERMTGSGQERQEWHEYARLPVPPDYPAIKAWGRPKEVMFPGLGAMDWMQYLESIDSPDRAKRVLEAMRTLFLTSQRVIIMDESKRLTTSLPLQGIEQVQLKHPPGAPPEMRGERLIEVVFLTSSPPIQRRLVGWTTRSEDAELFVIMLRELRQSAPGS